MTLKEVMEWSEAMDEEGMWMERVVMVGEWDEGCG